LVDTFRYAPRARGLGRRVAWRCITARARRAAARDGQLLAARIVPVRMCHSSLGFVTTSSRDDPPQIPTGQGLRRLYPPLQCPRGKFGWLPGGANLTLCTRPRFTMGRVGWGGVADRGVAF